MITKTMPGMKMLMLMIMTIAIMKDEDDECDNKDDLLAGWLLCLVAPHATHLVLFFFFAYIYDYAKRLFVAGVQRKKKSVLYLKLNKAIMTNTPQLSMWHAAVMLHKQKY